MKYLFISPFLLLAGCSFFLKPQESKNYNTRPSLQRQIQSLDVNKKNLCTITINSTNETDVFKKYLPTFNHIELAPSNPENLSWFQEACDQNIKCDVLMISGHFGGSFFSESTQVRLSSADLEQNSCQKTCSGILNNPKEVYLFGCNTLAGKTKDRRTPEEYAQVLGQHGYSPSEAQVLAAIRYSPMGNSFRDKMTRIFSGVPHIYGFDSIGPSGRNVEASLEKYFKSLGDYETYWGNISSQSDNPAWNLAMKSYAYAQTQGADAMLANKSFACKLTDNSLPNRVKLVTVQNLFKNEQQLLNNIEYLDHYFDRHEVYSYESKTKAIAELESMIKYELMVDQNAKSMVQKYLVRELPGLLSFQVSLLNVGKELGWWSTPQYEETLRRLFGDFTQGISIENADIICSKNISIPGLTIRNFKKGKWSEGELLAVACLTPKDPSISDKIIQDFFNKSTWSVENMRAVFAISNLSIQSEKAKIKFARFVSHLPIPSEDAYYFTAESINILLKNKISCTDCMPLINFFLSQPSAPNQDFTTGHVYAISYKFDLEPVKIDILESAIKLILTNPHWHLANIRHQIISTQKFCPYIADIKKFENKYLPVDPDQWHYSERDGNSYRSYTGGVTREQVNLSDDLIKLCSSRGR